MEEISTSIGGGTPSTQNNNFWSGNIGWISSSDLQDGNVNLINVTRYINEDAISNSATKLCPPNTIHIVSRVGVGKIAISNISLCTSQDFFNLVDYKLAPLFLTYQLQYKIKKMITSTQGTSIKGLTTNEINNIKIFYPNDIYQEKIGMFFAKIDSRIETQSKIIEDIESLIKGIRYQIFATKKHQFTDTKSFLLGVFLTEYSKKNVNNNLRSASIGKYGIRMRDEIYSKDLTNDYSKNKVIFKDTLSIGMGSTQIDIGILSENEEYCISPAYTTYKLTNINSKYLNEYLIYLNPLLSKRYMIIGARQGKSVNKAELLSYELKIHSEQEQLEIVKIFSSLFNKLQKEKDILSLYKKQKSYLLQNMFI